MAQQYVIASFRRRRNTIQQQHRQAYLGDERGVIDVPKRDGYVFIRYPGGIDENGYARFQQATAVRCAIGAAYLPNAGATVVIGKDADDFDCVMTGAWAQAIQAGITPTITNPLRREARFFTVEGFIPFKSYPVATGATNSTLVTVREWIYQDDNGDYRRYQGTQLEADKVELAAVIAPTGFHCYAVVWHDTWLEAQGFVSEVITVSTLKAITIPLDDTDLEECFDKRPADAMPTEAYYLADGQTTIRQVANHLDLRQMLNVPRLLGNPNPITKKMRVWAGRDLLYRSSLTVTGSLTVHGRAAVIGDAVAGGGSGGGGTGTVTSVGLTMPSEFGVSGSPVTDSGTLAVTKVNQSANQVYAGPATGSPAAPAFRALNNDDIPGTLSGKTITGGAIDGTPIGQTTQALGYFSAIRLIIGGFAGILSHAITAVRTWTFPDASGTVVLENNTATLTNKTLDGDDNTFADIALTAIKTVGANTKRLISRDASGVISDAVSPAFDNANHNHQNAAGGGQLTDAALSAAVGIAKGGTGQTTKLLAFNALSPGANKGEFLIHNGTNNVALPVGANGTVPVYDSTTTEGAAGRLQFPKFFKVGMDLHRLTNSTLLISNGYIDISYTDSYNGILYHGATVLDMATAGNWLSGSVDEAASEFVWIYTTSQGIPKLHNKAPNRWLPIGQWATMLVNQSGWNGTAANGLNATSVVYDNDTGEGNVLPGMLALIYASTDTDHSLGRGRGSGAAGSRNNVSAALITAINTGTNTLTLETGHNIAINDNDRILVIDNGALNYRSESGVMYRFVGAMFNNASSNLVGDQKDDSSLYALNEGSDISLTSTSMVDLNSALSLRLLCDGSPVDVRFQCSSRNSGNGVNSFDVSVDGIDFAGDSGLTGQQVGANLTATAGIDVLIPNLLPGTHEFRARGRVSSGTTTIFAGAGTANFDLHPQFSVNLGRKH